jgi:putative tryptophan/tyrosine transport system substrate-binding protein
MGLLMNSSNPLDAQLLEEAQKAARILGVELVVLGARNTDELDAALHALARSAANALLVSNDMLFQANKARITKAVRNAKLPAMYPFKPRSGS